MGSALKPEPPKVMNIHVHQAKIVCGRCRVVGGLVSLVNNGPCHIVHVDFIFAVTRSLSRDPKACAAEAVGLRELVQQIQEAAR